MTPRNRIQVRSDVRVDPTVVLRSRVLALSSQEIESAIENELAENPAMERLETDVEPVTDEALMKAVAPRELKRDAEDAEMKRCMPSDEAPIDWLDLAPHHNSARDHVLADLLLRVPPESAEIATFMVDSINDRGYLASTLEEIALACNVPIDTVEAVHRALLMCEPAGIGARSVVECLVAQLRDAETIEERLAVDILNEYLDDLVARRTSRISRRFKVLPNVVESAFSIIQELNPSACEGFHTSSDSLGSFRAVAVRADLVLRLTESGWEIEPQGGDPSHVCVSYAFRQQLRRSAEHTESQQYEALRQLVHRAEQFIQSLKDRRRTLRQIGIYLVERQSGFAATGRYEFLTPLTRAQVAHAIGIHESTVSRATMDKYVQLANGEIVPFEIFFKPGLRIQKLIEEILEQENPSTPLSDEAIAKLLEAKGVFVARRTVSKYRDRTRMLNSRTRRSA